MDIIYLITDTSTNLKYIGSKKNWKGPNTYWGSPNCKCKKFKKYELQQQWKYNLKNNPEYFKFEILESYDNIPHKDLLKIELEYQYRFDVVKSMEYINAGFAKKGFSGDTFSILTLEGQEDRRNKTSKTLRDKFDKMSYDEIQNIYAKYGEDNPNFGNTWNDEQRKHLSDYKKNEWLDMSIEKQNKKIDILQKGLRIYIDNLSEDDRKRIYSKYGEKNSFYGKHHTEETKQILREKRLKMNYKPSNMKIVIIENNEYESLTEASRQLNMSASKLLFRIRSNNIKFKNYNYKK
jgi:hypothetical protein